MAEYNERVEYYSSVDNVYHCCVQKTASQWLKKILSHQLIHRYSGLSVYDYERNKPKDNARRKLTSKTIDTPMPKKTIVTPLYLDFRGFASIPKPEVYKAFFIARDPRDVVVSWYFSMKYSHPMMGAVDKHRKTLNQMSIDDGLIYCIQRQEVYGLFRALESWIDAERVDPSVMVVKFEDITGPDQFGVFERLFVHLDIRMPDEILENLLEQFSFENLSRGRKRGQEDPFSHYRKGLPGDWKNYFNQEVSDVFIEVTGDLLDRLDYV